MLLIVLWTAFGLLSSAHFFFREAAVSDDASFGDTASHVLVFYWCWAILTPAVIILARRVMREGAPGSRGWATLALAAPVAVVVHGALFLVSIRLLGLAPSARLNITEIESYAMRHGGGDLATFAVLVGVYLLFEANRRARQREIEAVALEARLARSDLELLRWHLHPHFLFNALNTVSTLVLRGEAVPAEHAISLISQYLRAALSHRADLTVTLAEELAIVTRYVEIEKLRFGSALQLDITTDEKALTSQVPGLIVQPLVENAIRYGLARQPGSEPIRIAASVDNGRVVLTVADSGSGANGGDGAAEADKDRESDRFGLRYVRERLRQFYGDDAHFDLTIGENSTIAVIDLPFSASPFANGITGQPHD